MAGLNSFIAFHHVETSKHRESESLYLLLRQNIWAIKVENQEIRRPLLHLNPNVLSQYVFFKWEWRKSVWLAFMQFCRHPLFTSFVLHHSTGQWSLLVGSSSSGLWWSIYQCLLTLSVKQLIYLWTPFSFYQNRWYN